MVPIEAYTEINTICVQNIALKTLEIKARQSGVSATYSLVASRNIAICCLM